MEEKSSLSLPFPVMEGVDENGDKTTEAIPMSFEELFNCTMVEEGD